MAEFDGTFIGPDGKRYASGDVPTFSRADRIGDEVRAHGTPANGEAPVWNSSRGRAEWGAVAGGSSSQYWEGSMTTSFNTNMTLWSIWESGEIPAGEAASFNIQMTQVVNNGPARVTIDPNFWTSDETSDLPDLYLYFNCFIVRIIDGSGNALVPHDDEHLALTRDSTVKYVFEVADDSTWSLSTDGFLAADLLVPSPPSWYAVDGDGYPTVPSGVYAITMVGDVQAIDQ